MSEFYSYGPNHLKSGQLKMTAIIDHFYSIKIIFVYLKCSRLSKKPVFKWSGPKLPFFDHSKSGHVQISDPHCSLVPNFDPHGTNNFTFLLKKVKKVKKSNLGVRPAFAWPCGVDPLVLRSIDDVDDVPSMTSPVRLGTRPPPNSTPGGIGRDPARQNKFN